MNGLSFLYERDYLPDALWHIIGFDIVEIVEESRGNFNGIL